MKNAIAILALTAIGAIAGSAAAQAETIARYECTAVGAAMPEPIGDQPGHSFMNWQFNCVGVDGVLKGATYIAFGNAEWTGPKGVWISGGGVHRVPGGWAVSQVVYGTGAVVLKDGKPVGIEGTGTGVIKFASGTLAGLAGKTIKWVGKPVGFGRSILEMTD